MFVKRMYVEEGFLDGLDIEFTKGLNVLIGARGTGKTSVIELLRFCLAAPAYTNEVQRLARSHALAVLGTGRVTAVLDIDGTEAELTRGSADRAPRRLNGSVPFVPPILLSQGEIERLALDEGGRLQLLDDFRQRKEPRDDSISATQNLVASLTVEIHDVAAGAAVLRERIETQAVTIQDLRAAQDEERTALDSLESLAPLRADLTELNEHRSSKAVEVDALSEAAATLDRWASAITRTSRAAPQIPSWPTGAGTQDQLRFARQSLLEAVEALDDIGKQVYGAVDQINAVTSQGEAELGKIDDCTRPLRHRLEEAAEGAGELSRRVATLTQQLAQKNSIAERLDQVSTRLESLLVERRRALEELEMARLQAFEERQRVATTLNRSLKPLVRLSVERAGLHAAYTTALVDGLQGSGLHYNNLAPRITDRMSPRELAEVVERSDVAKLTSLAEIPEDRAVRTIAQLSQRPLSEILLAWVDDSVGISLLDGGEPKPIASLSTGQRCTVILPILLQHGERLVVIDQPEDNLDNAFVVNTLVRAIQARPHDAQLIVSTHNPNIPVIGNAQNVILLESTGRRGFVRTCGPLESDAIIDAITTVMEGGREAFGQRARFYGTKNSG